MAVQASVPGLAVRGFDIERGPFSVIAQPGERIRFDPSSSGGGGLQVLGANGNTFGIRQAGGWLINAPMESGYYPLRVVQGDSEAMEINLFVTVSATAVKQERLNGYRIGPPPPGHPKHPEAYQPPRGFIEVTEDMLDIQLSPHFRLRQFLCKQEGGFPKYFVLQESLLVMLEGLLQAVRDTGYPVSTFGIISGYRTPWYNRKIGNVPNSRHVYGDAMDLYIDLDGDGNMDDLDGDGDRDRDDVTILFDIATDFMQRPENAAVIGGVGRYGRNSRHGGFVHVDTRGYSARW